MEKESWRHALGRQLREGRKKQDLTQDQVADLLGLKGERRRETIRLYEAGKRVPSLENLQKLLSRLDVIVDLGWCVLSPRQLPAVVERASTEQVPFDFAQDMAYKNVRVRMTATEGRFQVLTQVQLKAS